MKKKIKYVILLAYVILLSPIFLYHRITHMNSEDIAWIRPWNVGDTLYYISETNNLDTAFVLSIEVYNSLNPINTNFCVSSDYVAIAYLNYKIIHFGDSMNGWFCVSKDNQKLPVKWKLSLCDRYALNLNSSLKEIKIKDSIYENCIIVDSINSSLGSSQIHNCGVNGLVWSKAKGLIQYSFYNGEKYTLRE